MLKIRAAVLALGFAILLAANTRAQITPPEATDTGLGGSNSITGMVLASAGRRLERRISIRLLTPTKGDRTTTTDEYGNFAFGGLVSGDYTLVIDKEADFEPYKQVISVFQIRGFPPQTYNANIKLVPKASAVTRASVVDSQLLGVPPNALANYKKGLEMAATGDRKGAIEQLKLATAEYPSFALAFSDMGVQYLAVGDIKQADVAFQDALKIAPDLFAALINHGIALFTLQQFKEAEPVLRAAVKSHGEQATGHYFLGQTLANLGNFDEAQKELTLALQQDGEKMKEGYRILAIIHSSRGEKREAADDLENYLKLAPNAPDAGHLKEVIKQLKGK